MQTSKWAEYVKKRKGTKGLLTITALSLSLFQLYTGFFGAFDGYLQRNIHLTFGLILALLLYPAFKGSDNKEKSEFVVNLLLIAAVIISMAYIVVNYEWITANRFMLISKLSFSEKLLGISMILIILEAVRRVIGNVLLGVVLGFLVYPFIGPYLPGRLFSSPIRWTELIDLQYLTPGGIFGIPLGVSAREIAIFIIFAAFINKTNTSNFMFNIAAAIAGKSKGGTAKIGVIASAFMGMLSGSGTANVITTGSITIPMMKRNGFSSNFAGAVEAVASTGGQIMPPIMGATAFVIVAFTGIPYITIMKYAVFPAILYFLAILLMVHWEACKLNLPGVEPEVSVKDSFIQYGHMLLPVFLMVYLLLVGYSPMYVGTISVFAVILASFLRPATRLDLVDILEALESAAKGMVIVIVATAAAGIIVGVVDLTGLGHRIGSGVVALSGGNIYLALIFSAIVAIILGMGMPTTAAYILQAALVIPALVTLGIPIFVAHMFAFYFACLSLITPPVAITSYTAAAIAGGDVMKTGWIAFRLGIAAYIIPFMFVFGPALLLEGAISNIVITVITALIGIFALSVSVQGYLFRRADIMERFLAFAAAILLIFPGYVTVVPGIMLLAIVVLLQKLRPNIGINIAK
ncbi:MAG: TRAP transporter permease [Clostridia bacterium]|nr:TRAP transporter permease [Clostridia bacterium]